MSNPEVHLDRFLNTIRDMDYPLGGLNNVQLAELIKDGLYALAESKALDEATMPTSQEQACMTLASEVEVYITNNMPEEEESAGMHP